MEVEGELIRAFACHFSAKRSDTRMTRSYSSSSSILPTYRSATSGTTYIQLGATVANKASNAIVATESTALCNAPQ